VPVKKIPNSWSAVDIGPDSRVAFEAALADAGVPHRVITYPGAPHSFFDRKADAFAAVSALAWDEVLDFTGSATGGGR